MIQFLPDPTGTPEVPVTNKPLTRLAHTNLSTKIQVAAEVHCHSEGQQQAGPSRKLDHAEEEGALDTGEELLKDFMS